MNTTDQKPKKLESINDILPDARQVRELTIANTGQFDSHPTDLQPSE